MSHTAYNTVLITGSSSGIGEVTAYAFARLGYRVGITYHSDHSAGQRVQQKCVDLGARDTCLVHLDITDPGSRRQALAEVVKQFGNIDMFINNAGVLTFGSLVDTSSDEVARQINTNLTNLIQLTREALPRITASIVNIGSALGLEGHRNLVAYSASKFGVRGFTQSLAKEYPNLHIVTVNPSLTATRMGGHKGDAPEDVASIVAGVATKGIRVPSGRDCNVRDFRFGSRWRRPVALLRTLKRVLKTI